MRRRLPLRFVLPLLLCTVAISGQAAVQSRIASVGASNRVALQHTIPAKALAGTDLGVASVDRPLDSLMLVFNRTAAQETAINRLLVDLQDPSSTRYHQWLTPEQYGAQFGLAAQDIATVSSWLVGQGFSITGTGRGSNYITFSGTVGQVHQSFGTTIHSLLIDGETHISNVTEPTLPGGIAAVVTSLVGLNDLKLKSRARTRVVKLDAIDTTGLHPQYTSSVSGNHYIAPGDFYAIYDVKPLTTSAITGAGITIAVVGQTTIVQSDLTAFRTASGLGAYCFATLSTGQTITQNSCAGQSLPIFATKQYGNSPGVSSGDLPEAMLDVEWSGAVAQNANVLYVYSTNVLSGSLISAINDNLAPIISISYGDCEVNFGSANLSYLDKIFQQANIQGQTIVGPSGDSGATDCDYKNYPAVSGLNVDYPSSSAYVTSAGGSMFNDGIATGATNYWGAASINNANGGSALGRIPEMAWNESTAANGLAAGGGGASAYFAKPYWQNGTGTPNDFSRDVPDISLNAASSHVGTLYCVSGSCVTGFRASDGQSLKVVGGTSVSAPSFAGILALVEQKIGSRIGNAGPILYALANSSSSATIFHDIVGGDNKSACTAGTPNCASGGTIGYAAGPGYDLATGWGSVDVYNLATKWTTVTPISAGTTIGQSPTTTTVTTASTLCGVTGNVQTINLAVKVATASGTSITSDTETIQILVDGVPNGAPVTLTAASSINFSTAGLSSGGHVITALYSGDTTFVGSKGFVNTDVVSSTKPDFSFTPCAAITTAKSGGAATAVSLTIAPVNGFTGSVSFSVTSTDSSLAASYTFAPLTVSISSTTAGTTSLVLSAFTSKAATNVGMVKIGTTSRNELPRHPWYMAGSGVTLASLLLLVLPRRRRWGALLSVVFSVAAFGAVGCGSSSNTGTPTGTMTTVSATPGTYTVRVNAFASTSTGTVSHSTNITFTVQ
jgi:subtilase family serine protease